MPRKAPGPCTYPGCPAPAEADARCSAHPRPGRWASGARGRIMPPGWPATVARILKRDPYCDCGAPATEAHHLTPGAEDDAHLRGKCGPCHHRITTEQATAARLGITHAEYLARLDARARQLRP